MPIMALRPAAGLPAINDLAALFDVLRQLAFTREIDDAQAAPRDGFGPPRARRDRTCGHYGAPHLRPGSELITAVPTSPANLTAHEHECALIGTSAHFAHVPTLLGVRGT